MPVHSSAAKQQRQSEKHRLRNKIVKSKVRNSTRKFFELVESSAREDAQNELRKISSLLDRAVTKGVFHRNTAARKKHRLHKMLNSMSQS